ncbi:pyruvate kinase [Gluconobacter thailandicus F149-1 = NBRC 100600]|nr:pyruvate kinase [Gluconobacter thailandicus]KXV52956.1 pyruvate kinase [Gluconobacter thailandicus]GAN93284.1 pyruvate kinase [Gluconobacter thailandicus F149-1 = NBRC 100600]GEL86854.1 pyruvate kinase [Gluconobacter thailandicus F149-1 = NBRC 100600]
MTSSSHHRRTRIVATLGPASSSPEMIRSLAEAGVNVFRLNFSHGAHEDHGERHAAIRAAETKVGRPLAILADLQGPKLRVGVFENGPVILEEGKPFRLDLDKTPGNVNRVCLPHPEIISAAKPGSHLLLDDGKLKLRVINVLAGALETEVVIGGKLSERKGVNVPDVTLPIPALTEKDRKDFDFALSLGVDFIALSFVQRPEDVEEAREIAKGRAAIVTKLEKPQAMEDLERIVRLSDAIMVARGDLGVELPPEEVPVAQKRAIAEARRQCRPVIVATQMLESMIESPTPTRAEVSDVSNAVYDGADAVMLSAESAAGRYPIEAVSIMARIASRVEQDVEWRLRMDRARPKPEGTVQDAIVQAAWQVSTALSAKTIGVRTQGGGGALRMARERPHCPILAVTPHQEVARRLCVVWGVFPQVVEKEHIAQSIEELAEPTAAMARSMQLCRVGDHVIVLAGLPYGVAGSTNTLRIITA